MIKSKPSIQTVVAQAESEWMKSVSGFQQAAQQHMIPFLKQQRELEKVLRNPAWLKHISTVQKLAVAHELSLTQHLTAAQKLTKQVADFQSPLQKITDQILNIKPFINLPLLSVPKHVNEPAIFKAAFAAAEQFRHFSDYVAPLFKEWAQLEQVGRRLEDAGFLPHYTTPFDLAEQENDSLAAPLLRQSIVEFYQANWASIEIQFIENIDSYDIDDEAKTVFKEALKAHGSGAYRTPPRLLFPEIERICFAEFYEGKKSQGIASLQLLRDWAGEMTLDEFSPLVRGFHAIRLHNRLVEHLYRKAEPSEKETLEADFVPNRHAALHGLATYNSPITSFNTLVMTEYIFQVVIAHKKSKSPVLDQEVIEPVQ